MSERRPMDHLISFGVGIGIGAALAILFAPKSGEETRQFLLDGAVDTIEDISATGRKLRKRAQRAVNEVAEAVMGATEAAERARHNAKSA